jgi:uncharacterized protein
MNWKSEWKILILIVGIFLACFYMPMDSARFTNAVMESLHLVKWYAREHVLLCLVPAFFIAGAIGVFISQASVMKYLGAGAKKVTAYAVASVSGSILAVCSCTVLPLFAGIYRMGAGLGPAVAFLYSGPAINILAIILTARILGMELGVARAIGAIVFSVLIGLLMHLIFIREERAKAAAAVNMPEPEEKRPLWQNVICFAAMVGILVFANWSGAKTDSRLWTTIYEIKWYLTAFFGLGLGCVLALWFGMKWWKTIITGLGVLLTAIFCPGHPEFAFIVGTIGLSIFMSTDKGECGEWFESSWGFAKQILPLLLFGVLIAGLLLGRVGQEGLIPSEWVYKLVGGNSVGANFFASIAGAFMYFATLTEVPIVKGLIDNGMGKGPALALLLAGPALSLPNMLVIRSVLGWKKTITFVGLVIVMAATSGMIFGCFFG